MADNDEFRLTRKKKKIWWGKNQKEVVSKRGADFLPARRGRQECLPHRQAHAIYANLA
jgi:hypothetical protein